MLFQHLTTHTDKTNWLTINRGRNICNYVIHTIPWRYPRSSAFYALGLSAEITSTAAEELDGS